MEVNQKLVWFSPAKIIKTRLKYNELGLNFGKPSAHLYSDFASIRNIIFFYKLAIRWTFGCSFANTILRECTTDSTNLNLFKKSKLLRNFTKLKKNFFSISQKFSQNFIKLP